MRRPFSRRRANLIHRSLFRLDLNSPSGSAADSAADRLHHAAEVQAPTARDLEVGVAIVLDEQLHLLACEQRFDALALLRGVIQRREDAAAPVEEAVSLRMAGIPVRFTLVRPTAAM